VTRGRGSLACKGFDQLQVGEVAGEPSHAYSPELLMKYGVAKARRFLIYGRNADCAL
jgi:hypothetical protein